MKKIILKFSIIIFLIFLVFSVANFKKSVRVKVLAQPVGCWGAGGVCNASCQYGTRTGVSCYRNECSLQICRPESSNYIFSDSCSSDGAGSCYIRGDVLLSSCYSSCVMGALCWQGCWPVSYTTCEAWGADQAGCLNCQAQGCLWDSDRYLRCKDIDPFDDVQCTDFTTYEECVAGGDGCQPLFGVCISAIGGDINCALASTQASCEACISSGGWNLCAWVKEYLSVASNDIGTVYTAGTQCTWYTEPTVETLDVNPANIGETQATLEGNIVSTGNASITSRGFDIGTSPGNYNLTGCSAGAGGIGTFSCLQTNLNPFQTYYFRAKACNSAGFCGYGVEKNFQTLDQTPPTVTVTGNPANWQNTDATADLLCSDSHSGCDPTSYRLKIYTTNPGTCSTNYSDYDISVLPYTISSHSWVCGAAKDNSGNTGFSSPVEFKVDKLAPTSTILSPGAFPDPGNWQNPPSFLVSVTDLDTGGSGLASCAYGVWDNVLGIWTVPSSTVRACSASFSVTVGPGADCRTEGQETCRIYVYSIDGAGNGGGSWRDFSISWTGPTTEILCNGQPCTDEPYLNSVEISLVCTPGSSTCEATFDCSDQTNTCDPNPCNP
jgi:hypothetical protein